MGVSSLPARIVRSVVARTRDLLTVLAYRRSAAALIGRAQGVSNPEQLFDLVSEFEEFRPAQIRSEFSALLRRVKALRPRASLEIGTATGGTAFLLARFLAGKAGFEEVEGDADGIGPVFNGRSCAECHSGPATGGSSDVLSTRIGATISGRFDPLLRFGGPTIPRSA